MCHSFSKAMTHKLDIPVKLANYEAFWFGINFDSTGSRVLVKSRRKAAYDTIAQGLHRLVLFIRTMFYCIKFICSLCNLIETTRHDSIPIDIVETGAFKEGEHRQLVYVDKKFGQFKKILTFTYGTYIST